MSEETEVKINIVIAREIVRQGDARLAGQLTTALAADARATTLCGVLGAIGVGLGAAVLTLFASSNSALELVVAGAVVAFGLLASSFMSALAASPQTFYLSGGDPRLLRRWAWNGSSWRSEVDLLDATGQRQAISIDHNTLVLERSGRLTNWALMGAVVSALLGLVAYFTVVYLARASS